jgi:hypothetical protein
MKDIFYTILVAWIVWRIYMSFSRSKSTTQNTSSSKKDGKTTVDFIPQNKKKKDFDDGDYVDYEEVK